MALKGEGCIWNRNLTGFDNCCVWKRNEDLVGHVECTGKCESFQADKDTRIKIPIVKCEECENADS